MRVTVAGPVKARRGQTVALHAKLRKGQDYAFCEVFSSVGEFQPSPHVPSEMLEVKRGEPQMIGAVTMRLSRNRPDMTLNITADDDCRFYIMQDVDVMTDPRAKGRITIHGTIVHRIAQAFRRLVRNTRG